MLAAAAVAGCFTYGVGAGTIPFITVGVATLTALWLESIGNEASAASRSVVSTRSRPRSFRRMAPAAPPPTPRWEVVETDGKKCVELRWPKE